MVSRTHGKEMHRDSDKNLMEWLSGHPIYIATKEWQKRKHRKKRINKKWLKRYGTYELNLMPHGQVVMMDNGVIWMTKQTYQKLFGTLGGKKV